MPQKNLSPDQFKDMLANYGGEPIQQPRKPRREGRSARKPKRAQEASSLLPPARGKTAQRPPQTLLGEVDRCILQVRKGADPREVANKLLRG